MKLLSAAKANIERRRFYLREEREEIAQTNMATLRYASLLTLLLLLLLLAIALLTIRDWQPSPYHFLLFPAALAVCIIAWLKGDRSSPQAATALCVTFEALLYVIVILIDTIGGPDAPSSFVQLVCIAMPALFVLPAWITYGMLLAAEVFYTLMVIFLKHPYIAQYDIFGMVTGLLFAFGVSMLVMRSRLKAHELKIRYETMSKRDTLSSLYNKRAFFETACRYFDDHNPNSSCSLAIIDIDDFKQVNDTFGHDVGDRVLSGVGDILLELYRPTDLIARFGGDEYLVLADRMIDESLIQRRFHEMRVRVGERSTSAAGTTITLSMGCVFADGQNVDFSELFRQADIALYAAKEQGKNACVVKRYYEK